MVKAEDRKWYVLKAISGKELKVKEYIEADARNNGLEEYISQALIPTKQVVSVRNGKRVTKEVSCYPGYVLVEAVLNGEIKLRLRNCPNVLGFLGGMDHPTPLRPQEVNRILGSADEPEEVQEEVIVPFTEGETVKVTFGPFSGFNGVIEEVDNAKKKLKVTVKIFGRKTPIDLGFMQVEKE